MPLRSATRATGWRSVNRETTRLTGIALVPSVGRGGGIERYWKAIVDALVASGAEIEILPLLETATADPNIGTKARFAVRALSRAMSLRRKDGVMILIFHPALAPLGAAVRAVAGGRRAHTKIFFYGLEAWRLGRTSRWLMRRLGADLIAISAFTAGSIVAVGNAYRLTPGLEPDWYDLLTSPRVPPAKTDRLEILTVFRLAAADEKGARTLLGAVEHVLKERDDFTLTMAGHGPAPVWLRVEADTHSPFVRLVEDPTADELAELYRGSDLFVLATHTGIGSGEGFGIVLLEAQLAQVPVIAPAFGGSGDALVDGVTGFQLADESPEALARLLLWCLDHRADLLEMGENARTWAMAAAAPARFAASVLSVLSNGARPPRLPLVVLNREERLTEAPRPNAESGSLGTRLDND